MSWGKIMDRLKDCSSSEIIYTALKKMYDCIDSLQAPPEVFSQWNEEGNRVYTLIDMDLHEFNEASKKKEAEAKEAQDAKEAKQSRARSKKSMKKNENAKKLTMKNKSVTSQSNQLSEDTLATDRTPSVMTTSRRGSVFSLCHLSLAITSGAGVRGRTSAAEMNSKKSLHESSFEANKRHTVLGDIVGKKRPRLDISDRNKSSTFSAHGQMKLEKVLANISDLNNSINLNKDQSADTLEGGGSGRGSDGCADGGGSADGSDSDSNDAKMQSSPISDDDENGRSYSHSPPPLIALYPTSPPRPFDASLPSPSNYLKTSALHIFTDVVKQESLKDDDDNSNLPLLPSLPIPQSLELPLPPFVSPSSPHSSADPQFYDPHSFVDFESLQNSTSTTSTTPLDLDQVPYDLDSDRYAFLNNVSTDYSNDDSNENQE